MKKSLTSVVAVAAAAGAIFGAAPAWAINEYAGMTYEKAVESIKNGGGTAVISSRVGDYLPTEKCEVSGSRTASFLDTSGSSSSKVMLDLNCNDPQSAGHSGFSVMTPEGKKAQQLRDTVTSINKNFEDAKAAGQKSWCEENADRCAAVCKQDGAKCSADVLSVLGL